MLLVPQPPLFAAPDSKNNAHSEDENADDQEMNLIESGTDAVPAPEPKGQSKKRFRLLVIGKKGLPDPDAGGGGKGGGRKQVFWATASTVGEDLKKLEEGLGPKQYETKTRGMLQFDSQDENLPPDADGYPRNSSPSRRTSCRARSIRDREQRDSPHALTEGNPLWVPPLASRWRALRRGPGNAGDSQGFFLRAAGQEPARTSLWAWPGWTIQRQACRVSRRAPERSVWQRGEQGPGVVRP